MADLLVARITGASPAAGLPVELNLILTDQTLLGTGPGAQEPAVLDGYGPIPAPLARRLATPGESVPAWIRRLYAEPGSGRLVAMETQRRAFTAGQRRFLQLRDQNCRTPYCDAPIRHSDHIRPRAAGGPTSLANGQGLCEACNYVKQTPGWHTELINPASHETQITTPTGHKYRSRPPDPPRAA